MSYGLVLDDLVVTLNSSLMTSNEEKNKISKRKITHSFNGYIDYIMPILGPVWNLGKEMKEKEKYYFFLISFGS